VTVSFKPSRNVTVVVDVDSIFDKLYGSAHSRMDPPGRSFYATLDVEF